MPAEKLTLEELIAEIPHFEPISITRVFATKNGFAAVWVVSIASFVESDIDLRQAIIKAKKRYEDV